MSELEMDSENLDGISDFEKIGSRTQQEMDFVAELCRRIASLDKSAIKKLKLVYDKKISCTLRKKVVETLFFKGYYCRNNLDLEN